MLRTATRISKILSILDRWAWRIVVVLIVVAAVVVVFFVLGVGVGGRGSMH